jgi:hypothetical protein
MTAEKLPRGFSNLKMYIVVLGNLVETVNAKKIQNTLFLLRGAVIFLERQRVKEGGGRL